MISLLKVFLLSFFPNPHSVKIGQFFPPASTVRLSVQMGCNTRKGASSCTHTHIHAHTLLLTIDRLPCPGLFSQTLTFRRLSFIVPRGKPGQMGKQFSVADFSSVRETMLLAQEYRGRDFYDSMGGVRPGQCPRIWL